MTSLAMVRIAVLEVIVPVAIPRTVTVEDWVPTLPASPVKSGIKIDKAATVCNLTSLAESTEPLPNSPRIVIKSHGIRAR